MENRLVGIKSRELYEAPAGVILHDAHRELESLCLSKQALRFKTLVSQEYADMIYNGLWFSALPPGPVRLRCRAISGSFGGLVRVKFFKGKATVVGRKSEFSLYSKKLATYDTGDQFDHDAARGFIKLHGLGQQTQAQAAIAQRRQGVRFAGTAEARYAMSHEMMNVDQLADLLQRDARELHKLASRGYLPAHKVSGEYRFHPVEINHWLESQMHAYTEQELSNLEQGTAGQGLDARPLITTMLSEATIAVPLAARTKASLLKELVTTAEQSWQVYDPEAILQALKAREELGSTALESGVAICHPRQPLPAALGEPVIAFGRTFNPLPFGAPRGGLTDLFFLVCCRDSRTHLQVLARLSRLMLRPEFFAELREAENPAAAFAIIEKAEADLLP